MPPASSPGLARRLALGLLRAGRFRPRSDAILFDREGTLVQVSSEGEHDEVRPIPGAADAVARARAAGIAIGVVTSQSGELGLSAEETERVNAQVADLVGPVDVWLECTHAPDEDCPCRKPAPGLIYLAAAALGTRPERCIVVGDAGSDVEAARAAGARVVLVPSERTTPEEIDDAPAVASSLEQAVAIALGEAA